MPMIDVYAKEGTFRDRKALAKNLAAAVMRWEKVPDISLFRNNTAAFVHDLPADALSNVAGDSNYVRVQVLTPVGVLDRDKQLGVVKELTDLVAAAAGDPSLRERTAAWSPPPLSRPSARSDGAGAGTGRGQRRTTCISPPAGTRPPNPRLAMSERPVERAVAD